MCIDRIEAVLFPAYAARHAETRHAEALQRLRVAHQTLEARIKRIQRNKLDRDREIVELHRARRARAAVGTVSGGAAATATPDQHRASAARLKRLLARRHMCDLSASRFEQMLVTVEQQLQQLEDWAALEQTTVALRGGAVVGAEQMRLLGGIGAVDAILDELTRQRDAQSEIAQAMDEYHRYDSMPDAEAEDELVRLMEDERIAEQFAAIAAAPSVPDAADDDDVDPLMSATRLRAVRNVKIALAEAAAAERG